jgi:tRNA-specific 2-thiouridylase
MSTVIVAMSGGVDSSVAALLLKKQGNDVIGITFKNFDLSDVSITQSPKNCCSVEHLNNARKVCDQLGIPHYVINRIDQFKKEVLDDFKQAYLRGITPNPCVRCNSLVRWPELIHLADDLNAEYVATGHYAKIITDDGRYLIRRADNSAKDQSYALWGVNPEFLKHTLFPIGEYVKADIRQIAKDNSLSSAGLPESQDICFVPEGSYTDLLDSGEPGEIVTEDGEVLGEHKGLQHYTIGQRRGLGIAYPEPLYVLKIDLDNNRLIVGTADKAFRKRFTIHSTNWFIKAEPGYEINCRAKIRYRHEPAECAVKIMPERTAKIEFAEPARAITPGQSAVFYDGPVMIGGGVIDTVY